MATIVPSRFGEALQRSSENLLNMIISQKQLEKRLAHDREMQEERIGFSKEQAEIDRLLGLTGGRMEAAAPGQTFEQLGIDPQLAERLGLTQVYQPGTVLRPHTPRSMIEQAQMGALEGGEISPGAMERSINALLGLGPVTETQLQTEDLTQQTEFNILSERFQNLTPRDRERYFEQLIGIPPSIEFNFGGRTFQFESAAAAQTALGFMNYDLARARESREGRDEMLRYREALKTRMESFGVELFGLGNARARAETERIIRGDYNDPAKVAEIQDPNVKAFVSAQLSSRDLTDNSIMGQFLRTPQGQSFQATMQLGAMLESVVGKDKASELIGPITQSIGRETDIPIGQIFDRSILRGRLSPQMVFPANTPGTPGGAQIPPDLANDPLAVQAFQAGVPIDFIRQQRGTTPSGVTAGPAGNIDLGAAAPPPAPPAPAAPPPAARREAPPPARPAERPAAQRTSPAIELLNQRERDLRERMAKVQSQLDAGGLTELQRKGREQTLKQLRINLNRVEDQRARLRSRER